MILQSLVRQYESLAKEGAVPIPGWSIEKTSFVLDINEEGILVRIIPLNRKEQRGKKFIEVPQTKIVPEHSGRSGKEPPPYFLCDNAQFFMGLELSETNDDRNKYKVTATKFAAAKKLHEDILCDCQSRVAVAVKKFFAVWKPQEAEMNPILQSEGEVMLKSGNCIFRCGTVFAEDDPEIKQCWNDYYGHRQESKWSQCLITGKLAPIARLHPKIKGVKHAQSVGANLVSFNAEAYSSYGHEQGQNAPVSEYAAFAYGAILNKLLADQSHVKFLGDMTIVYWAEKNNSSCQDVFAAAVFGDTNIMDDNSLDKILQHLVQDEQVAFQDIMLDYENPFYILGLAPSAARLSVRFFLQGSFGDFLQNVKAHRKRINIISSQNERQHIPVWALLQATVSPNAQDKSSSPILSGAVLQAILSGMNYPMALYQQVLLRIRAETDHGQDNPPHYKINSVRVAIIKAFLIKNKGKEEATVELNEDLTNTAYVLGRIFSVWEAIQKRDSPDLNATIKDKYFNAACATPARIFPILQKISGHHLRKLEYGLKVYYDKMLTGLMSKLDAEVGVPRLLNLEQQGMFILGYYHQTKAIYLKKGEK